MPSPKKFYLLTIQFDMERESTQRIIRAKDDIQAKRNAIIRSQNVDPRVCNFSNKWRESYDRANKSWIRYFRGEQTGEHEATEEAYGEDYKEIGTVPEHDYNGCLLLQYFTQERYKLEKKILAQQNEWEKLYLTGDKEHRERFWYKGQYCSYFIPLYGWATGIVQEVTTRNHEERTGQSPHIETTITVTAHPYSKDKILQVTSANNLIQTHLNSPLYIKRLSNIEMHHVTNYENQN